MMYFPAVPRSEHRRLLRFFTILPVILGALVILIAGGALVGWSLGYASIAFVPGQGLMLPITAACFVVSGASLVIAQRRESLWALIVSRALAFIVAGVGLFVLLEYALGWQYPIDMLWIPAAEPPERPMARMAMNTALAFVLFAQGLIFLATDRRTRGIRSQVFATLALIVAFVAIVGHLFDVRDFYSFRLLSGMGWVTAVTFALLATGLLFSQLDRGIPALVVDDGAAGFVSRRLLPGALLVPFGLAMLGVLMQQRGLVDERLSGSLVSVADMVIFLLLIAWSARVVRDVDAKRGELFVLEREAHAASERARSEAEIAMTQAEAARTEAERANGAKSDFLAVMSHELRTPLAAIMGYQELLADGITGPITEAQAQQLGRIKASARHLLSLIDEILTFTRLDAGRETVLHETMDLDTSIDAAVEIIEPLAESKKIDVKVVSPGKGTIVESDPIKVRQILVNLLSNAVKFTDTGSVTVEAKIVGKEFQLIVSDTGIGIPQEHLNRIFDPFWQVEQKATRRATGTGLGLTVTRRLANLLGGDVAVSSNPGEGTTFTVILPVKAPHIGSIPERGTHLRAG